MSEDGYVVVVVGAASEVGRELRQTLRDRGFPIASLRLYDAFETDDAVWADDESGDEVLDLEGLELEGADVLFICGQAARAGEWAARAAAEGALAIDATHTLIEPGEGTLVVPEVNAEVLDDDSASNALVCPVPGATALSVLLKPLQAAAELKRIAVAAYEPVSNAGRAGIDALVQQTRDLLSGASAETRVFPHRVAFNIIPQLGDFVSGGRTRGEWAIESQTRRVLDLPDLPIAVTAVVVPTFFGQGYAVSIETEQPLDAATAETLLRQAPGVLLADAATYPTLVDVLGSEATHVGRVRDDPTLPFGVALWAAIDGLRKGAAVNAVQIAERALLHRH